MPNKEQVYVLDLVCNLWRHFSPIFEDIFHLIFSLIPLAEPRRPNPPPLGVSYFLKDLPKNLTRIVEDTFWCLLTRTGTRGP